MVGFVLAIVAGAIFTYLDELRWQPGPQPIMFSHRVHVGERQIDCTYCHRGPRAGDLSGVPAVLECAGCHSVIKEYKGPQKDMKATFDAEIAKLQQHIKDRTEISWSKVYDLSEHVKFSHQAHTSKGFDCSLCHGQLQEMNVTKLHQPAQMGWCVDCHKANGAPVNCSVCHF